MAAPASVYHGVQPIDFLRFMDELVFIEATIDAENEARLGQHENGSPADVQAYLLRVSDAEYAAQLEANASLRTLVDFPLLF